VLAGKAGDLFRQRHDRLCPWPPCRVNEAVLPRKNRGERPQHQVADAARLHHERIGQAAPQPASGKLAGNDAIGCLEADFQRFAAATRQALEMLPQDRAGMGDDDFVLGEIRVVDRR
jgi:hypothetical protein